MSNIRHTAFAYLESAMAEAGIDDLSPAHGDILYIIHARGDAYVSDIVEHSHRDKSTISNIINQLVKKGYVEKLAAPEDGRRVRVRLSKKAKTHMEAMAEISGSLQEKLFQNMSEEEQNILFMLLAKVGNNLKK